MTTSQAGRRGGEHFQEARWSWEGCVLSDVRGKGTGSVCRGPDSWISREGMSIRVGVKGSLEGLKPAEGVVFILRAAKQEGGKHGSKECGEALRTEV